MSKTVEEIRAKLKADREALAQEANKLQNSLNQTLGALAYAEKSLASLDNEADDTPQAEQSETTDGGG